MKIIVVAVLFIIIFGNSDFILTIINYFTNLYGFELYIAAFLALWFGTYRMFICFTPEHKERKILKKAGFKV